MQTENVTLATPQKYLFIGGPVDGQRIETDGRDYHRVHVPRTTLGSIDREDVEKVIYGDVHEYHRWEFSPGVFVYVCSGETMRTAAEKLLACYRPGTLIENVRRWDVNANDEAGYRQHVQYLCDGGDPTKAAILLPPVWKP